MAITKFVTDAEAFVRFVPLLLAETAPAVNTQLADLPDDAELKALLVELQTSLQSFNMSALDQFAQLKQALQQLNPEWLGPLESALEQLNFVQAVLYTEQYQTLLKGSD